MDTRVRCARTVLLLGQLFFMFYQALGFSGGASTDACSSLTPWHGSNVASDCGVNCPFTLSLIEVDGAPVPAGREGLYRCGAQHTLLLESTSTSDQFRGMAIQARESTGSFDSAADFIGQFVNAPTGGDWRVWSCNTASATHTNNDLKTAVNLTWEGPGFPSSDSTTFWFSIVRGFANFHIQLEGPVLSPDPAFCAEPGVQLGFAEEDYAVVEGNSVTVTINKEMPNTAPIGLSIVSMTYGEYLAQGGVLPAEIVSTVDSVTAAQSTDFSDQPISFTFPASPGSLSMSVSLGTVDDFINEAQEGYLAVIRVDNIDQGDEGSGVQFVREGVALIRITDNDGIRITFRDLEVSVQESAGVVNNMIVLEKMDGVQSEQNLSVILNFGTSSASNAAVAGSDFVDPGQQTITFLPTDTSLNVEVEILQDTETEQDEIFFIQITLPSMIPSGLTVGNFPRVTVTIDDDDGQSTLVGFFNETYTVFEGDSVTIGYGILSDINLVPESDFATLDLEIVQVGSTAEMADYNLVGFDTLVFLERSSASQSFVLNAMADDDDEGPEEVVLMLTLRTGIFDVFGDFQLFQNTTTVIIMETGGLAVLELTPAPLLTGIEGETVQFICGPIGADSITLEVNGVADASVTFDDSSGNRTYTLGPLTRQMNGTTYQCRAGALSTEITTLLVYFPPEYTSGVFFDGNEGNSLGINLSVDSFPFPPDSFVWTYEGQPLVAEPGRVTVGLDFIQFTPLLRGDRGSYTVTATNIAGSGNATFDLETYYPPEYVFDPVYTFLEGDQSTVQLVIDARPLPGPTEFTWFFNGQPLTTGGNLTLTLDSISWTGIRRQDSGTYTIEATNRAGTGNATFMVDVIYPPVYTVDSRITVFERDPVRINLTLDANPDPLNYTWEFNGNPLTPPTGGGLGVDYIDFGPSVNRTDAGVYFIESTNDAGSGNATFELVVYYPPTYIVDPMFVVTEGDLFDITLPLDALPPLTADNVTWFFNDQILAMLPGITFGEDFIRIQTVTRMDVGTYRVEGTNVAGTGVASFQLQVIIPTTTPGPLPTTLFPSVIPSVVPTTTQVVLSTSTPGPETSTPVIMPSTPVVMTSTPVIMTSTPIVMTPTPSPPVTDPPMTTMFGDPHFSVLLPSGQQLCFTVQGEHGYSFNLISSKLLHMNALFAPDPHREEVTWIGSLGIVVKSKKINETKIRFDASEKAIYIGEKLSLHVQKIDKLTFSNGKLSISEALRDKREKQRFSVAVELVDVGLSFSVDFVKDHLDMTWHKVKRQPPKSHGILGQFFRNGVEIDEARRLLVLPDMDPVPVMRKPVWHFMERDSPDKQLCWVAMNPGYQGKKLLQGHYLDYLVDDVLSTDFKFKAKKYKKLQ